MSNNIINKDINNSQTDFGKPLFVNIEQITPNPDQPRKLFNKEEITKLANSIIAQGIIEPLVVRETDKPRHYELIAGHRRLIAAKEAGLTKVPVIISKTPDDSRKRLELAMIENIIRDNLNPIEEAEAYLRLVEEIKEDITEIAKIFGKDRTTIANSIRLLNLPEAIQEDIKYGRMTAGHGRAILSIINDADRTEARSLILSQALTVRQAESLAKKLNNKNKPTKTKTESNKAFYEFLETSFSDSFGGLKVSIKYNGPNKRIDIYFNNNSDIDTVISKLTDE
jgi:ParB family chromosome partitioning protein